ncbi:MAG: hypothetical protein ABI402_20290 [Ferruginibacter sp.]
MERTQSTQYKSKSLWVTLVYFVLSFYYFGVIMMTYFVNYPALSNIHEHTKAVMDIFNNRMMIGCYIPSILLVGAAIGMYLFSPTIFPRRIILVSVILIIISVVTTIFFIVPIQLAFSATGLTEAVQHKLLPISLALQIMPAALNVLIVLFLLNMYVRDVKLIGKWLFIIVFALNFYTVGTNYVEAIVNYSYWGSIGSNDWLAFRFSGGKFFQTFLIPAFLPFLLIVPLFWLRPKAIPKSFILVFWLAQLWIFITTSVYFVPKIQLPLNHAFSINLIEDLNRYDFILRGTAGLVLNFITGWMLLKIGLQNLKVKE